MNGDGPIRFRGTPLTLSALSGAAPAAGAHRLRLAEPEHAVLAGGRGGELHALSTGDDGILRLHLPRSTPPGTYRARIEIGGEERDVEMTVEPDPFLRLLPDRLVLSAAPGAQVPEDLTLANLGNTTVEVRGAYAFGLFDVGGMERAVLRMMTVREGERRADALADAVADEHGGLVRVRVESGAGPLPPGETRALHVSLHIPQDIRPGHSYWGTWPLDYLQYYVRVSAEGGAHGEAAS